MKNLKKKEKNETDFISFESLLREKQKVEIAFPLQGFTYFSRASSQAMAYFLSKNDLSETALLFLKKELMNQIKKDKKDTLEKWLYTHQLKGINFLIEQKNLLHDLKKISFIDLSEKVIEVIRSSIKNGNEPIKAEEILEALLVSLLYPLRQTIGACFATSFTILLQKENPKIFLEEQINLISKGFLKRVIEGKEYIVAFNFYLEKQSADWIDIKKANDLSIELNYFQPPALLKALEYTIASMTEFNLDSHTLTLSLALGLDHNIPSGLGVLLQSMIEEKHRAIQEEAKKAHVEAQIALDQVNLTNHQMMQAYSEEKVQSLKAQGFAYEAHLQASISRRDQLEKESQEIGEFYPRFFEILIEFLKEYFQEAFDPSLKTSSIDYNDSPAGFRLVCKHGRQHIKSWTWIQDEKEYIHGLKEFFIALEHRLKEKFETRKLQELIDQMTSRSIQFIYHENFSSSGLERLKKGKTIYQYINPWSYLSGGTLRSLMHCFLGKENPALTIQFYPKDPLELCIKLIDFFKDAPGLLQDRFLNDSDQGVLIQSESHAFILKPGFIQFCKFWSNRHFSYTDLRDFFIAPMISYYKNKVLSEKEISLVLEALKKFGPMDQNFIDVKPLDIRQLLQNLALSGVIEIDKLSGFIYTFLKFTCSDFPEFSSLPFADTNWAYFNFSFVVNPYSLELEIWRESFDQKESFPMVEWGNQFSGKSGFFLFLQTLDAIQFSSLDLLKFQFKV